MPIYSFGRRYNRDNTWFRKSVPADIVQIVSVLIYLLCFTLHYFSFQIYLMIMKLKFAKRMSYIKASEIREILKVTEREDVISFAGGLPAPELFPIDEINKMNQVVLQEAGAKALQYTTTEGYYPLREWIAKRMNERLGTSFDKDNILITHGSQQGLDLSGKVFLDDGDIVLCESPTYLAAISAF